MTTVVSDRELSNRKVSFGTTLSDIVQIIANATHGTSSSELKRMLKAAGVSMATFKRYNRPDSEYWLKAHPFKVEGKTEWYWSRAWVDVREMEQYWSTSRRRPAGWRLRLRRPCSVKGCERQHYAKGWCQAHYRQQRRVLPTVRECTTN